MDAKILAAMRKKAEGYIAEERVEEQQNVDGELQVVKVKVSYKDVPPDVSAVKWLAERNEGQDPESMTEEQLRSEKERLLRLLKENNK